MESGNLWTTEPNALKNRAITYKTKIYGTTV